MPSLLLMIIVLIVLLLAGAAALARGGSVANLGTYRFRASTVLIVGFGGQLGVELLPLEVSRPVALVVVCGSTLAALVFLVFNRSLRGIWFGIAGLALNLIVIAANGAMPVATSAARTAGIESWLLDPGVKHERLDDDTLFPWLADVIPLPGLKQVISVGDVLLAIGMGLLVFDVMTRQHVGAVSTSAAVSSASESQRGGGS